MSVLLRFLIITRLSLPCKGIQNHPSTNDTTSMAGKQTLWQILTRHLCQNLIGWWDSAQDRGCPRNTWHIWHRQNRWEGCCCGHRTEIGTQGVMNSRWWLCTGRIEQMSKGCIGYTGQSGQELDLVAHLVWPQLQSHRHRVWWRDVCEVCFAGGDLCNLVPQRAWWWHSLQGVRQGLQGVHQLWVTQAQLRLLALAVAPPEMLAELLDNASFLLLNSGQVCAQQGWTHWKTAHGRRHPRRCFWPQGLIDWTRRWSLLCHTVSMQDCAMQHVAQHVATYINKP